MPTQNLISSDDIAHLVTEVLKRIRTETKTLSSTDSRLSTENHSALTATLPDRVIAAETIMNLGRGTKVAYIINKAVITPSARDIARERGIDFITAQTKPAP